MIFFKLGRYLIEFRFVKPFKVHPNDEVTAASIVSSLGTFHNLTFDPNLIYCPARYAARLSQAFTATDAVKVDVEEVIQIPDICTSDGKYQFTDGVGTLSKELSRNIWAQLKQTKRRWLPKEVPPAYQIRFMGSKGMISVDHTLAGSVICLRPSMVKFLTPETVQDIEIARAFDKPGPYFLNRPLIMLLEGLGVPFRAFKRYQDEAVQTTRKAASSLKEAASLLECHGLGASYRLPWILHHLDKLSLNSLPDDDFYQKMLGYATHHILRDLKNHSRIPVPGAWTLVGVADTHRYLQENQIFACIKPISGGRRYLSGRVLISRSPTIHPGDVRVVDAIGAPPPGSCFEEEPLANTVVFSVQGIYLNFLLCVFSTCFQQVTDPFHLVWEGET
jgi:RNA-dependent RNA polymerase